MIKIRHCRKLICSLLALTLMAAPIAFAFAGCPGENHALMTELSDTTDSTPHHATQTHVEHNNGYIDNNTHHCSNAACCAVMATAHIDAHNPPVEFQATFTTTFLSIALPREKEPPRQTKS